MSEYLILIFEEEKAYAEGGPEVYGEVMEAHRRFSDQVPEIGGKIIGGEALQPTSTATTIRNDVVTDGPFAETKEQLGGYYMLDVPDLDEAIKWAQKCPGAEHGTIELRPVMEFDQG